MVSILKEIDINEVFDHFAQKKCINHQKRKASSICLHENCWKLESDQAFFCVDCNVDHIKKHENSVRFNALFTDELLKEFDEFTQNQTIKDQSKVRISKFENKINELHGEIEQRTRSQFAELKNSFQSYLVEKDYFGPINNLKKMLTEAQIDLRLNYESKEKLNRYCTQIKHIQNELNGVINNKIISEGPKDYDEIDEELNLKLQNMANEIQENVKNQVNQLAKYLIDCNKKGKLLKNESIPREVSIPKIDEVGNTSILVNKMPIMVIED